MDDLLLPRPGRCYHLGFEPFRWWYDRRPGSARLLETHDGQAK
jgi:hypothetical protein